MKYIYSDEGKNKEHWLICEKYKSPYIEVGFVGEEFANIFFDITNICSDLEAASEKIRFFYTAYVEFFNVYTSKINDLKDQYYFFNLIVKKEHVECIASQLYDFLSEFIKSEK